LKTTLVSEYLSYTAAMLHILAFYLYGKKILKSKKDGSGPNAATWTIWAFGSFLTLINYDFVAEDLFKETVAMADAFGCLVIFCISFGRFQKLGRSEWVILAVDGLAILVWLMFRSATYTYAVLQISATLSVIPTCVSTWKNPKSEPALVWFLWALAYGLSAIVVLLRWEQWVDIVYPLNYMVMHLAVAVICLFRQRHLQNRAVPE
jgi:hypothetical protein